MPTQKLPNRFYTSADAAKIDRQVIDQLGVPGYRLMVRAAQAAFEVLRFRFPNAQSLVILAGAGNNAGDGYALAEIVHRAGWQVTVLSLVAPATLQNEAGQAVADCLSAGVSCSGFADYAALPSADIYVDALFGIGLSRPIAPGEFMRAIQCLNSADAPVLSLDVPSGLAADTGQPLGAVVKAQLTITFIVVKRGLLTAQGPDIVGELWFDDLGISADCAADVCQGLAHVNLENLPQMSVRAKASHKGSFGDVLVVGGDHGMAGAAVLAAEAAMSSGAGRVTLVTQLEHLTAALMRCPEVLSAAVADAGDAENVLAPLLAKASVVVLGPGLGMGTWGQTLAQAVINAALARPALKLVLDADALNLIASGKLEWPKGSAASELGARTIMTPHPLEAARLLNATACFTEVKASAIKKVDHDARSIQSDRFQSALSLADAFSAHILLKGAGTVLAYPTQPQDAEASEAASTLTSSSRLSLCTLGNPGMAVAGMGDVLSGVLGALFAQLSTQGLTAAEAMAWGVATHAAAGDWVWQQGQCVSVRPVEMMAAISRVLGALQNNVGRG